MNGQTQDLNLRVQSSVSSKKEATDSLSDVFGLKFYDASIIPSGFYLYLGVSTMMQSHVKNVGRNSLWHRAARNERPLAKRQVSLAVKCTLIRDRHIALSRKFKVNEHLDTAMTNLPGQDLTECGFSHKNKSFWCKDSMVRVGIGQNACTMVHAVIKLNLSNILGIMMRVDDERRG